MNPSSKPTALIVDLCGTTIFENTTDAFVDRWLRLRGPRRMVRYMTATIRPVCLLAVRGLSQEFLYRQGASYIRNRLATLANPVVLHAIRDARKKQIPVYLVTASIDPVATAVGEQLALNGVISSRLLYKKGKCTGMFALDVIERKLEHLKRVLPDSIIAGATVYTDHRADSDLIRAAAKTTFFGSPAALPDFIGRDERVIFVNTSVPGGINVAG